MWQIPRSNRVISAILVFVTLVIVLASAGQYHYHSRDGERTQGTTDRHAYALLLTSSADTRYFVGTRVMIYQLLHSPFAGDIPVVVLVTSDVTQKDRARLRKDGARVIPVEKIPAAEWMDPGEARWIDLLTKLRIFELTEYDKICYLDTDILIVQNIDGVFDDEATRSKSTKGKPEADGMLLPSTYTFAARTDSWDYDHSEDKQNYFNGGFLLFKPSKLIFDYYMSLTKTQDLFSWDMMEQSLVNYAHRQKGPMPWQQLRREWNTDHPGEEDYKKGIKSFHDKFWDPQPLQSSFLRGLWEERVAAMEDYYKKNDGSVFSI